MKKCRKCKHGLFFNTHKMPRFYLFWVKMRQKCLNQNCRLYPKFGAIGVKICKRWDKYVNFQEDMLSQAKRAEKKYGKNNFFFCRIDDSKDFSPKNCCFLGREDYCDKMSTRRRRREVIYKGKVEGVTRLNGLLGHQAGSRLARGIDEKYILCDKIPYHQKSRMAKIDRRRDFFLKNKSKIKKIIGNSFRECHNFEVVDYRFGDKEIHSGAETGAKFQVSTQRVFQIMKKFFNKYTPASIDRKLRIKEIAKKLK